MPAMEQQRIGSAGERWQFVGVVRCLPVAGHGWRLLGMEHGGSAAVGPQHAGSQLIIDIVADDATSRGLAEVATTALRDVVLQRQPGCGTDWWLEAGGKRWLLAAVKVFAHRDIGKQAVAAIPPRRVSLRKRVFWSTLLTVLRTDAGRRWVRRRYGV